MVRERGYVQRHDESHAVLANLPTPVARKLLPSPVHINPIPSADAVVRSHPPPHHRPILLFHLVTLF